MDAVSLLRGADLFAPASDDGVACLAAQATYRTYARGDFLYHAGDPARALYVIAAGRVAAKLTSKQGMPLLFHVAKAGEAAGQIDLLQRENYTASAQALSAVTALALPAGAAVKLLETEPAVLLGHARQLARIVAWLTESMSDLVFLDLERRLAQVLTNATVNGEAFDLDMTQAELAARLGVARQSVNAALGKLSSRGLLDVNGGRIIRVLDRPALVAFVESEPR